MNAKKMMVAAFAVLIMMAVPFAGVFADDADASTTTSGTYNVYAYNGANWSSDRVSTYDAAQAVKASSMWDAGDSMVPKHIAADETNPYVTYNWQTYGNISKFMGLENDSNNVWNVYVHVNGSWQEATVNLGSYKCFDDYNINYRTANICLYYAADSTSAATVNENVTAYINANKTTNPYVELTGTTTVTETPAFMVRFVTQVKYTNDELVVSGEVLNIQGQIITNESYANEKKVILKGYGSDAYLALKDAVGAENISAEESIPGAGYSAYSWMNTMFNIGTIQTAGINTPNDWTDDTYAYWCIYDTPSNAAHLADFVLGAYSPLTDIGSPFHENQFHLIYDEVTM